MTTTKCYTKDAEAIMAIQKMSFDVVEMVPTDNPEITKLIMSGYKFSIPKTHKAPMPGALMSHKKAAGLIKAENKCLGCDYFY